MNRREFAKKFAAGMVGAGLVGKMVLTFPMAAKVMTKEEEIAESLAFLNNICQAYIVPKWGGNQFLIWDNQTEYVVGYREHLVQIWNDPKYYKMFKEDIKISAMSREDQKIYFATTPKLTWEELA